MERESPLAGLRQRFAGRFEERALVSSGDPEKLKRLEVVMREHLGPVLRAVSGQRLDPGGRARVLDGPLGARDL